MLLHEKNTKRRYTQNLIALRLYHDEQILSERLH